MAANVQIFRQPIQIGSLSADPGSASNGEMYYNTTSNVFKMYQNGAWQVVSSGSGFADTALDNLASVAINTSLLAASDNAIDLGSGAKRWRDGYIGTLKDASAVIAVDVTNRLLKSAGAATVADFSGSVLKANSGVDFNSSKGVNLASGTTSTDAVNYGQVILTSGANAFAANQPMGSHKLTGLSAGTTAGDSVRYEQAILTSGVNAWAANQDLGGFVITGSGSPVNPNDLVPKTYVDNFINATSWKTAVLVSTTANITLSGEQTIDGVTTSGSRVLVKNQTSSQNNGIYVSASGAWSRSSDMNSWANVPAAAVFVESGTVGADLGWVCTSQPGGTLGTTAITFVQFSSAGAYTADGVTLQLISGVFSIKNGGVGTTQLGTITDNVTLDQSGSGSTLEVKTGGISNTQINVAAAIAYSKLNLTGSIVNADIASGAAIARSKLASGTAYAWVTNNTSGVMSETSVTANRAVATDSNGLPVASLTTDTELGYVHGVTSAIQTQLSGKASTALSNLASTAVNVSIIAASDNAIDLGSAANKWRVVYADTFSAGNTANLKLVAPSTYDMTITAASVQRSTDGTNFLIEVYTDSSGLSDGASGTFININNSAYSGIEITYVIEPNGGSGGLRIGTLRLATTSSVASLTDTFTETADAGVTFSLGTISGSTTPINYTTTSNGANRVVRFDAKYFRQ